MVVEASRLSDIRTNRLEIMKEIPDIVVSGINKGANMGDDVIHSGTLGAALTARKLKFPPLAISISGKSYEKFQSSVIATELMLDYIVRNYSDEHHGGLVFNMNVPNIEFVDIASFCFSKVIFRGLI